MALGEGAIVEIVELTGDGFDPPCIRPTRVLVNGTDVGLIARGCPVIKVEDEEYDCTTVTLVLLAKRVEIKAV